MRKQAKWLIALGLVLTLAGCGKNAAASTSSSSSTSAPKVTKLAKGGVVSAAKMTTLSKSGHNFSFTGKAKNGITYRWDYTAAQVKNPTKQKLGIKLTTKHKHQALKKVTGASDALGFKLSKFYLAGSPTLTITIPKHWSATAAVLLSGKHEKLAADQPVSITRSANSTKLSFRVTEVHKTFYIIGTSKQNKAKAVKKAVVAEKAADKKATSTKAKAKAAKSSAKAASSSAKSTKSSNSSHAKTSSTTSSSSKQAAGSSSKAASSGNKAATTKSANTTAKTSTAAKADTTPTVTISISAATAAKHLSEISSNKRAYVPSDGWILAPTKVKLTAGESVYDVLKTVTRAHGIQMESRYTPMYKAYYIKGINNLYEFDGGSASGWMYSVDGWFPNYGCSAYNTLKNGSNIKWVYTLELGADVGGANY